MNQRKYLVFAVLVAAVPLASCSGPKNHCVTSCGGNNGTLPLTLSDPPPAGVTVLSYLLPISGITLTPNTGSQISVFSGATLELTRLQSDTSAVATGVSVPAGSYKAINVTLGTSRGQFFNASGATVGGCSAAAVCAP